MFNSLTGVMSLDDDRVIAKDVLVHGFEMWKVCIILHSIAIIIIIIIKSAYVFLTMTK